MSKFILVLVLLSQIETAYAGGRKGSSVVATPDASMNFKPATITATKSLNTAKPAVAGGQAVTPVNEQGVSQPVDVAMQNPAAANVPAQTPTFYSPPNISANSEPSHNAEIIQAFLSMLQGQPGVPPQYLPNGQPNPAFRDYIGGKTTYNNEYGPLVDNGNYEGLNNLPIGDLQAAARALRGHTCNKNDRDRLVCMVCNLYFEARGETRRGQLAVAQVTMSRVFSKAYSPTVCGVVYEKSQFSWTQDNISNTLPDTDLSALINVAAEGLRKGPSSFTHYYSPRGMDPPGRVPEWAQGGSCAATLTQIDNQRFCSINGRATRSVAEVAEAEGLSVSTVQPDSSTNVK